MHKFTKLVLLPITVLALSACAQSTSNSPAAPPDRAMAMIGEMCGGMMGTVCGDKTNYCHMDISAQCGATDQTGTCRPKPEMCTMQYDPVCGCDGKTYGNECTANTKGVSAAYKGECES